MKPSADELHAYIVWMHVADVSTAIGSATLVAFLVFVAVLLRRDRETVHGGTRRARRERRREHRRRALDPWPSPAWQA